MLGPGQVADLWAGVHTLQWLRRQGVPKSNAAVGSAAPRGEQAMLVGRPGNGFHCSQVIHVYLHWAQWGMVPHQQLRGQISPSSINILSKCRKTRGGFNKNNNSTLLSLPPEASSWWSVLHFKPHTSCLCPCSRLSDWSGGVRTSLWRIIRSRLPEDNWSAFQANAPVDRHRIK